MSPCLLIFEDIDTIVTKNTRSYFFNEVDVSSHFFPLLCSKFVPTTINIATLSDTNGSIPGSGE